MRKQKTITERNNPRDIESSEALIRQTADRLMPDVARILTQISSLSLSERGWAILIRHWTIQLIAGIYNYTFYDGASPAPSSPGKQSIKPVSVCSDIRCFSSHSPEEWNKRFETLLGKTPTDEGTIAEIVRCSNPANSPEHRTDKLSFVERFFNTVSTTLARRSSIALISTYLPKRELLILCNLLKIPPHFWSVPRFLGTNSPDASTRASASKMLAKAEAEDLESLVRRVFFTYLPICYLEDLPMLADNVENFGLPKRPNVIFATNFFAEKTIFQLWLALQIDRGAKYIAGQHGNYLGHVKNVHSPEEVTADLFLTWGTASSLVTNHRAVGNLKMDASKPIANNSSGGIMVMLTAVEGEGDLPDVQRQGERHLDRNKRLVKALRGGLISDICVRFHHQSFRASNLEATNEKMGVFRQDLIALEEGVSFDYGRAKFRKIISRYRLVISGYDGTGFLELLAHDFPTIMLVGEDFGSWLTPSARADYGKLIEAKLLFTDPEALAVHVVKIWHDVDSWWKSAPVEIAKENFGRGYSQANKNKVKEIAAIIRDFQNP